jgi:RNA polymerase sigma-70 factor (ECF subfamily)
MLVSLRRSSRSPAAVRQAPSRADKLRLRRIFDDNYDLVWRLLRRIGVPSERVEDTVQQVFLITAERLTDVVPGSERAFVYGVAVRLARSLAKRAWREVLGDEADLHCSHQPAPDELLSQKRLVELCDRALGEMRLEQREVFVLFEIQGLTAREIAALLGLPPGTVASRLRRARQLFRTLVDSWGCELPKAKVEHGEA